ncbi:MAG: thymidylate synthase [Citrobacter sp.]
MKQLLSLLQHTIYHGEDRPDRTGTGVISGFSRCIEFDLRDGFPLLTTKKVNYRAVFAELAGFIEGATSAARFRQLGTKIWDQNANENESWLANPARNGVDDLGRVYGAQWRNWQGPRVQVNGYADATERMALVGPHTGGWVATPNDKETYMSMEVDQLQNLIHFLKHDPYGRRHLVLAYNPAENGSMALPPCHILFQCYVSNDKELDMQVYMRSVDLFLGLPFNIASYAALLHLIAKLCDYKPRHLTMALGDYHIYKNHVAQVVEQISRKPMALPELTVANISSLREVTPDTFQVHGYESHPVIKAPMAV